MPAMQRSCARRARDVDAVEADRAGVGVEIAGDQVEQRRLAGAVRADDAERLAARDRQIDAVGGLERAEGLGEAAGSRAAFGR